MAGISGLGILTLIILREVPMIQYTDETYGLEGDRVVVASAENMTEVNNDKETRPS